MKKAFYFLLIATFIWQYSGKDCYSLDFDYTEEGDIDRSKLATGVDDCESRDLPDGYYRCCFLEYSGVKMCVPIDKDSYDDIDDMIDEYEKEEGVKDVSLDCGSNYIVISLLSLILLFL